jgi:hypothetical protein
MAHGYLREFDEAPDRSDDRGRDRGDERERSWRTGERDRNFMLGEREPGRGREEDRLRGEDRQYRSAQGNDWGARADYSRSGGGGDRERSPRNFSSHQDDHYRSWRDRQMEALDRDYQDYCREREQQFHSDFDSWRRNREQRGNRSNEGIAEAAELELTHERALSGQGNTPSPVGEATLGTNNSENTGIGRAKPSE